MPSRNIELTDHFDRFVEDGISSGRYRDADEVMAAALRLLEWREAEETLKQERLSQAIQAGIDSAATGDFIEIEPDEIEAAIARIGQEASEAARRRAAG